MIELECCKLITLAIKPGLKADSWLAWVEPQGVNDKAVSVTSWTRGCSLYNAGTCAHSFSEVCGLFSRQIAKYPIPSTVLFDQNNSLPTK